MRMASDIQSLGKMDENYACPIQDCLVRTSASKKRTVKELKRTRFDYSASISLLPLRVRGGG